MHRWEKSYYFVVLHKLEEGGGNNQKNTLSKLFLQLFLQLLSGEKWHLERKKGHFTKILYYSTLHLTMQISCQNKIQTKIHFT